MKKIFAIAAAASVIAASSAAPLSAAQAEYFCTHGETQISKEDSIACYSDRECVVAAELHGYPVRDYSKDSVPFALARGKIVGVVTDSRSLIRKLQKYGAECRKL